MAITHWETSNFEVWVDTASGTIVIEFRCPKCHDGDLVFEGDKGDFELSMPFEEICPHCGTNIFCQFKLVMDW